jgi:Domain of unknown function (DUF4386)
LRSQSAAAARTLSDSDAKISLYYASHSHQARQIVAWIIFLVGLLIFFLFLSVLRSRLLAAEGAGGRLAALAYGAGLVSAALFTVALSAFQAPAFLANDTRVADLTPAAFRIFNDFGYEVWVAATVVGAVVLWATAALALRTLVLPRWFAWVSIVAGVILLFAVFFIPVFVYWGWIVVAGALLAWRGRAVAELPRTTG